MTDTLPKCDFCNERTDEAKQFDDWVACGICTRMIESKRWHALLEYAIASVYINSPKMATVITEQELREAVRIQHQQFKDRAV